MIRDVADRYGTFGVDLVAVVTPAVSRLLAVELKAASARAGGGDARLSGLKNGETTGDIDTAASGSSASVTLTPHNRGAWTLATSGSNKGAWWIPKAGPVKPGGGRRHRITVGGDVRWSVKHGAVRGRGAWTPVVPHVEAALPDLVHAAVAKLVG